MSIIGTIWKHLLFDKLHPDCSHKYTHRCRNTLSMIYEPSREACQLINFRHIFDTVIKGAWYIALGPCPRHSVTWAKAFNGQARSVSLLEMSLKLLPITERYVSSSRSRKPSYYDSSVKNRIYFKDYGIQITCWYLVLYTEFNRQPGQYAATKDIYNRLWQTDSSYRSPIDSSIDRATTN